MWSYDGHTFETYTAFLSYMQSKFGTMYDANFQSFLSHGTDLAGVQVYHNGTSYLGYANEMLLEQGYTSSSQVIQNYSGSTQQLRDSQRLWEQVADLKVNKEVTFDGVVMQNDAIQLGDAENGSTVLTMTKSDFSPNGTLFNNTSASIMEEEIDPQTQVVTWGTVLGTMGWLPVSSATVAASSALGVLMGVGMYTANPDFWDDLAEDLFPYAFRDVTAGEFLRDQLKLPVIERGGLLYMSLEALGIIRDALVENGAFSESQATIPADTVQGQASMPLPWNFCEFTGTEISQGTYEYTFTATSPLYVGARYVGGAYPTEPHTIVASEENFHVSRNGSIVGDSVRATYNNKDVFIYTLSTSNGTLSSDGYVPMNDYDTDDFNQAGVSEWQVAWLMVYGGYEEHGGLPDTQLDPDATYPTDTTKNLAEIYPDWATNKISVLSNPQAANAEDGMTDWYPISLSNTNFSSNTDYTSSTQTQQEAQSGTNTDPAQVNQIAQAIQDLTETLTREGTLPENPTIPTDTTGDTPTPTPPVITGAGSDLIAIYNPTKAEIQAFNAFLWSLDPTNLTNWKKVIANPIDAIISLAMIYVTPVTGASQHIKCGYIETDVSAKVVTNQYVDIDCGTVDIDEYFHNVWDYEATRISIYLPFIGIVPLHVGDVMGSRIRVRYRVDVYTGTCLAQIIVLKENSLATLYTYTGNCSVQLPLTSGSFSGVFSTLLAMGASAMAGDLVGAAGIGVGNALRGHVQQQIQRSGNIGSNAGAMGIRTPYVIITRNKPLDAYLYQNQYGFPANKTVTLGDMRGYTRVKSIHLSGIACTDDELEEIERLLKEGVIIN